MKKLLLFCIILFCCNNCTFSQKITADAILGQWLTSEKECMVEIYKKQNSYYGKVCWLKEPLNEKGEPVEDTENPDPRLRTRHLLGTTFMFDFEYEGEGRWTNGTVYNARNGKTYKALLKMDEPDILYLHGYIGIPALGMDSKWTRQK